MHPRAATIIHHPAAWLLSACGGIFSALKSPRLSCLRSACLSFAKPSGTDGQSAYCRAEPGLHELSRADGRQYEVRQTTDELLGVRFLNKIFVRFPTPQGAKRVEAIACFYCFSLTFGLRISRLGKVWASSTLLSLLFSFIDERGFPGFGYRPFASHYPPFDGLFCLFTPSKVSFGISFPQRDMSAK